MKTCRRRNAEKELQSSFNIHRMQSVQTEFYQYMNLKKQANLYLQI